MCHGRGYNVIFNAVTFTSCTLLVLQGAQASFHNCSFTHANEEQAIEAIAVYAHACSTQLHIHNCRVSGGVQGIAVMGGAHASVTSTIFSCQGVAADISGHNSVLYMTHCKLMAREGGGAVEHWDMGLAVRCSSKAVLRNVAFCKCTTGVVTYKAESDLLDCNIANCRRTAVHFLESTGSMHDCIVLGNRQDSNSSTSHMKQLHHVNWSGLEFKMSRAAW